MRLLGACIWKLLGACMWLLGVSVAILAQDGLGRVPVFYHFLSMATAADVCVTVASQAGKIWKRHRRALPPSAKALLAELLLDLRLHILPDSELDAVGNIGRAKYDIRGIAELLKFVSHSSGPNVEQAASGECAYTLDGPAPTTTPPLPCPPPPPPMPVLPFAICSQDLEAFRRSLYYDFTGGVHDFSDKDSYLVESFYAARVCVEESSLVFTLG